jgi:hypothetical protein
VDFLYICHDRNLIWRGRWIPNPSSYFLLSVRCTSGLWATMNELRIMTIYFIIDISLLKMSPTPSFMLPLRQLPTKRGHRYLRNVTTQNHRPPVVIVNALPHGGELPAKNAYLRFNTPTFNSDVGQGMQRPSRPLFCMVKKYAKYIPRPCCSTLHGRS